MSSNVPRLFSSEQESAGVFGPSALSIGNFDGVHRGHQALLAHLDAPGLRPSVLTFEPHPTRVLAPERAPRLLSTLAQRARWMGQRGVEQLLVLPFTREFAQLTPADFVERIIVRTAAARRVVVGDNFRFGHKAAGDTAMLRELGARHGFEVIAVSRVQYRARAVSSTQVRSLLDSGHVAHAARLLTRPYALEGTVVSGHGIGSKQTVPTLNLATRAEVIPANGVYVTRVRDLNSSRAWPSVTNIGFRPTFEQEPQLSIESFILEGFSEPAPVNIAVEFLQRLREERKFPDAPALRAQILRDAARASAFHRRVRKWVSAPQLV